MSAVARIPRWRNVSEYLRWRQCHSPDSGTLGLVRRRVTCLVPITDSILPVRTPGDYEVIPRCFTPDGKQLIAISLRVSHILIYKYNGAGSAASLLRHEAGKGPAAIADKLFKCFFTFRFAIPIPSEPPSIKVHASIVTHDSQFLFVLVHTENSSQRPLLDPKEVNESVPMSGLCRYQHWSLMVINLCSGQVTSQLHFNNDVLCAPTGAEDLTCHLYNYTFVVLSVPKQTLRVFHLSHDGDLVQHLNIGRFANPTDELVFQKGFPRQPPITAGDTSATIHPYFETAFVAMKQKLLAYLFRKATREGHVSHFLQNFMYYRDLRIARFQLLSERLLLLRFELKQVVWRGSDDHPALLLLYDYEEQLVVNVFESSSLAALNFILQHPDRLDNYQSSARSPAIHSLYVSW